MLVFRQNTIQDLFGSDIFFDALEKALPAVFTREEASRCMGGLFSSKSLSNMDAQGIGPSVKVKIGKKIGYERKSFMCWIRRKLHSY